MISRTTALDVRAEGVTIRSMILRALTTFKNWALSGSAQWELVPGRPSRDAAYVRALVFRPEDIEAAADLLVRMHEEQYPETANQGLRPMWFHSTIDPKPLDPQEVAFDFDDLGHLSRAEKKSLRVSAFGALLEFGNETPATVYWGDDLSRKRVEAAYDLLRARGRHRIQVRRLTWALFVLTLVAATIITSAYSLWETFTTAALWLFAPTALLAVAGLAETISKLRSSSRTRLPHRLLASRAKSRSVVQESTT